MLVSTSFPLEIISILQLTELFHKYLLQSSYNQLKDQMELEIRVSQKLTKIEIICSNVIKDAVQENYESDHDS